MNYNPVARLKYCEEPGGEDPEAFHHSPQTAFNKFKDLTINIMSSRKAKSFSPRRTIPRPRHGNATNGKTWQSEAPMVRRPSDPAPRRLHTVFITDPPVSATAAYRRRTNLTAGSAPSFGRPHARQRRRHLLIEKQRHHPGRCQRRAGRGKTWSKSKTMHQAGISRKSLISCNLVWDATHTEQFPSRNCFVSRSTPFVRRCNLAAGK